MSSGLYNPFPVTPSAIGAQPVDMELTQIAALAPPIDGFLTWNGSAWVSKTKAEVRELIRLNPSEGFRLFDDFFTSTSGLGWTPRNSNSGTIAAGGGDANHIGIVALQTNATNNAIAMLTGILDTILFGGGAATLEILVKVETLITAAAEEFTIRIGFIDNQSGVPFHGVWFEYAPTSANWICTTKASGAATETFTTTTPVTTNWVKLKIEINASGTQAIMSIDGVAVKIFTANVPNAAGQETALGFMIQKSVGTTNRRFLVDYVDFLKLFSIAR